MTPLFLLNTDVLPDGLLPLRLFEIRYIDMVRDCLRQEQGFVVCPIQIGAETLRAENGEPVDTVPYPAGCYVKVVDWHQDDQGLLNIICQGQYKVEVLHRQIDDAGLHWGAIQPLPEEPQGRLPEQHTDLGALLGRLLQRLQRTVHYPEPQLDDAQWVCRRLIELLPLQNDMRYQLWRNHDIEFRLQSLLRIIDALAQHANDEVSG